MAPKPTAILFDLDDTLLDAYRNISAADLWADTVEAHAHHFEETNTSTVRTAISESIAETWRGFRRPQSPWPSMSDLRRDIVRNALSSLGLKNDALAHRMADQFSTTREQSFRLADDALNVLSHLRDADIRLALVTNGASVSQRWKIDRFALEPYFDHIQIEEEAGFGKPSPQAYHHAMGKLDAEASTTWMIGDNYEWEVDAPKSLGIFSIWYNPDNTDKPEDANHDPDHEISGHSELVDLFEQSTAKPKG